MGVFWQMPCPHAILEDSLKIRRLPRVPPEAGTTLQIQKNGKIQKSQPWDGRVSGSKLRVSSPKTRGRF